MTQEELEFISLVSLATHIADWKLLGCILEGTYGVLSGEEERRLDRWLESHFVDRHARRIFVRIMEPGLYISQIKRKERST